MEETQRRPADPEFSTIQAQLDSERARHSSIQRREAMLSRQLGGGGGRGDYDEERQVQQLLMSSGPHTEGGRSFDDSVQVPAPSCCVGCLLSVYPDGSLRRIGCFPLHHTNMIRTSSNTLHPLLYCGFALFPSCRNSPSPHPSTDPTQERSTRSQEQARTDWGGRSHAASPRACRGQPAFEHKRRAQ
jgi:hypothetical protein